MDLAPEPFTAVRPRLLLVEDDVGLRRSLQLLLHGRGFDVRAFSGATAIAEDPLLDEANVLVVDYRLPDSDGLRVLDLLRARGWQGRAVLVTGFLTPELDASARAAGFEQVLEKPLRQHDLLAAIGIG